MDLGDKVFACGFTSKLENAAPNKSKRQEQVLYYGDKVFAYGEDSHPLRLPSELGDLRGVNANLHLYIIPLETAWSPV